MFFCMFSLRHYSIDFDNKFLLYCVHRTLLYKFKLVCIGPEARRSAVGWGTMLQAGWLPVQAPGKVDFFNLPNPSSRTVGLGSTQPVTEMSTRNFPGDKKRPARRADNLAAIYEPNV
jgi:hypothetical protein